MEDDEIIPCVLMLNGSFCPIHRNHVSMVNSAIAGLRWLSHQHPHPAIDEDTKQYLAVHLQHLTRKDTANHHYPETCAVGKGNDVDWEVSPPRTSRRIYHPLRVFLTPTHDSALKRKLKEQFVPWQQRTEMIRLAVRDASLTSFSSGPTSSTSLCASSSSQENVVSSPSIEVDTFQCEGKRNRGAAATRLHVFDKSVEIAKAESLQREVRFSAALQVIQICGADALPLLLQSLSRQEERLKTTESDCNISENQPPLQLICVVNRPLDVSLKEMTKDFSPHLLQRVLIVKDSTHPPLSSTAIRTYISAAKESDWKPGTPFMTAVSSMLHPSVVCYHHRNSITYNRINSQREDHKPKKDKESTDHRQQCNNTSSISALVDPILSTINGSYPHCISRISPSQLSWMSTTTRGIVDSRGNIDHDITTPFLDLPEEYCLGIGRAGAVYRMLFAKTGKKKGNEEAEEMEVAVKVFVMRDMKRKHQRRSIASMELELVVFASAGPHPSIVECFGCGSDDTNGAAFIVMELCNQGNASSLFLAPSDAGLSSSYSPSTLPPTEGRNKCTLAPSSPLLLFLSIAHAMAHLESHAIIHRDLTLDNVLVHYDYDEEKGEKTEGMEWRVKLCDFSVSISLSSSSRPPARGSLRHYSPQAIEKAEGEIAYTSKDDVYMFGCLMWECLHRQRVWANLDTPEAIQATLAGERPLMSSETLSSSGQISSSISSLLCDLITACWEHTRQQRPSFAEIVERLQQMNELN